MSIATPSKTRNINMLTVFGRARVDRRTKRLAARIDKGEIAVIDHKDLDSTCARKLAERHVAAVVNASPSISGRYPNTGPKILTDAGILILDNVGSEIMEAVKEGDEIYIQKEAVWRDDQCLAQGVFLSSKTIALLMKASRNNLASELESFAENTLKYVREEKSLIVDPLEVPDIRTKIKGKDALIVVRGEGYKEDLAIIRSYLHDVRPVLIGVDGGADALMDIGFVPDMIVGDMDSVSDEALRCGAELVVHAYGNGNQEAPGLARIKQLGLDAVVFPVKGTSEDMAMLLAYEKDAELIVAVGGHFNLIDFLDKGRAGMSSTFLTRLKVGSRLVDAKGVSRLYRSSPGVKEILALLAAALVPILVVAFQSPAVRTWMRYLFFKLKNLI